MRSHDQPTRRLPWSFPWAISKDPRLTRHLYGRPGRLAAVPFVSCGTIFMFTFHCTKTTGRRSPCWQSHVAHLPGFVFVTDRGGRWWFFMFPGGVFEQGSSFGSLERTTPKAVHTGFVPSRTLSGTTDWEARHRLLPLLFLELLLMILESCGCHCRYCLASFSPRSLLPMVSILFVAPYSKPGSRLLSGHVMQWIFHWVADSGELLFVWQSHLPWLAPCNSCTYLQRSAPGINATPVERGAEYITTSLAYTRKKTSLVLVERVGDFCPFHQDQPRHLPDPWLVKMRL